MISVWGCAGFAACLVFRPQLQGRISEKTWRRLRRLADATNESRNLEVERAWIRKQLGDLAPAEQSGAQHVLAQLADRQEAADRRVRRRLAKSFEALHRKLEHGLAEPLPPEGEPARVTSAGAAVRRAVRRGALELERRLAAIHTMADWEAAHQARISAKRLRYLLEPFERAVPDAAGILHQLRVLQNVLGQLQDAHVVAQELREELGGAAAAEPGIHALVRRLRTEGEAAFAKLQANWLDGRAGPLLARLAHSTQPRSTSAGWSGR